MPDVVPTSPAAPPVPPRKPSPARDSAELHTAIDSLASWVASVPPEHHGFAFFDADLAHRQAEQVDFFDPAQDLAGWIIPAKDLVHVAGMPTTLGNIHRRVLADRTDPLIARLLLRGAVVPGKTLTSEYGMTAYTEPVGMPAPHNPRFRFADGSPARTPGGSSGGAAVLVAQGQVLAAHASDGGGSIRVPAAATGVIGLKPAHDTSGGNCVSHGFVSSSLDIAMHLHQLHPEFPSLRVGVMVEPLHARVSDTLFDPLVGDAVEEAAAACVAAGHRVVQVQRPYPRGVFQAFQDGLCAKATKISGESSAMVAWLRKRGWALSSARRSAAFATMASVQARVLAAWDIDVLLCPTLAFAPPLVGAFSALPHADDFFFQTQWTPWGALFNMSGGAALSVPWLLGDGPVLTALPDSVGFLPSIQLGGVRVGAAELCGLALQLKEWA